MDQRSVPYYIQHPNWETVTMHGRNEMRSPTETARHTAHLASPPLFFFWLWLPTPASRSATEDRGSRTHHHAMGCWGLDMNERQRAAARRSALVCFPVAQQPANRKAPCRDQGAGDCYLKQ